MKQFSQKTLTIILIAVFFVSLLYFSSRTYVSYRHYQLVQSSDIYIDLIHHLDNSIQKLEDERVISALYLGTKGNIGFQNVAAKRQKSDNAIAGLETYITQQSALSTLKQKFANLPENLRYIRSRVDVINENYRDILFDYYQQKIISPLLKEEQRWLKQLAQSIASVSHYFTTYAELVKFRDTINQEQSFIAYFIAKRQKMTMPDLMQWETILKEEQIPNLKRLSGKPVYPLLHKTLHEDELIASVTRLRRTVLKGIGNGNYMVDTSTWMQQMQQNANFVTETEQTLFDYLKSLDFKAIIPVTLYVNLVMAFASLIILIFLIRRYLKAPGTTQQKLTDKNPDIQIKHFSDNQRRIPQKQHEQTETQSFALRHPELESDTEDMPLTNIAPKYNIPHEETEEETIVVTEAVPKTEEPVTNESTFSPIRLLKEIIKPYISLSRQHQISFHYAIDPSLPDICIGDEEKIREILTLFLDAAMETGNARKEVILQIENIAQKKFETALSFTIKDSGKYLSPEERRKIKRGSSKKSSPLTEAFSSHNRDFIKAGQLVRQLDGSLQIQSDQKEGTEFVISINLKKFISTEQPA